MTFASQYISRHQTSGSLLWTSWLLSKGKASCHLLQEEKEVTGMRILYKFMHMYTECYRQRKIEHWENYKRRMIETIMHLNVSLLCKLNFNINNAYA